MNILLTLQLLLLKAQLLQAELSLQSSTPAQVVPMGTQTYTYPTTGDQHYEIVTNLDGSVEATSTKIKSVTVPPQIIDTSTTIEKQAESLRNEYDNWLRGWEYQQGQFSQPRSN